MLEAELLGIVTPETVGDPMGARKWVRSSLRRLSQRLAQAGHPASAPTVSRLLQKHDDALRVNAKEQEAGSAIQTATRRSSTLKRSQRPLPRRAVRSSVWTPSRKH